MAVMNISRSGIVFGGAALALSLATAATSATPETIVFNYVITNTSNSVQSVDISNSIAVSSYSGPITISGSITGTLTDLTGNGATLSTNSALGIAIYSAWVDNQANVVRTLMDPNYVFTFADPFLSGNFTPETFTGEVKAVSVTGVIGIRLAFDLSPGDSVSFTSIFTIVPGPAALAALGMGIVLVRRRRS